MPREEKDEFGKTKTLAGGPKPDAPGLDTLQHILVC